AYTGDGTSGILAWGNDVQAGTFRTSHIPTTSGTATRNADVASGTIDASWTYNANAGTLAGEVMLIGQNASGQFGAPIDLVGANNNTDFIQLGAMTSSTRW